MEDTDISAIEKDNGNYEMIGEVRKYVQEMQDSNRKAKLSSRKLNKRDGS